MDHENQELSPTVSQSGEPQEVVLRYEAPVTPIVERYVQPTPLPGQPKKHTSPRKKRKGLKIFLFCMLGLLLVSGVVTALWLGGAFDDHRSYHDDDFEQRHDEDYYDNSEHGETTIKRLPNTDQVKLRYNESHGEALTIQEIYQKVNPSTVTVLTGNRDGSAMVGTGVIFTEDGYILTNAHVIAGGSECYVVLDTGEDYRACLLGLDEEKDLAVIKIAASGLPAAEFGDSDALTVGDPVYAIGNPLGVELRGTLTDGIVSAINRDVYVDGVTMTLIQTNAALNNGNSGGPLINCYGQVIGINTMKIGAFTDSAGVEGLGFAIPSSTVKEVAEQLISQGYVSGRPTLGLEGESLSSFDQYYYRLPAGLYITDVDRSSDAAAKGIEEGDILLSVNGTNVTTMDALNGAVYNLDVGDTVEVVIYRSGKQYRVSLTVTEDKG